MKANELRLGNYVLIHNPKSHPNLLHQPVQVVEIQSRNDIYFPNSNTSISVEIDVYNGFSQFNEFIKPIPLTEKWLLDFGFKKFVYDDKDFGLYIEYKLKASEDVFMVFANDFSLAIYSEESVEHKDLGVIPNHKNTIYVHQLQNLYFALTGEELIYKK